MNVWLVSLGKRQVNREGGKFRREKGSGKGSEGGRGRGAKDGKLKGKLQEKVSWNCPVKHIKLFLLLPILSFRQFGSITLRENSKTRFAYEIL